jgi:hypothetical protein
VTRRSGIDSCGIIHRSFGVVELMQYPNNVRPFVGVEVHDAMVAHRDLDPRGTAYGFAPGPGVQSSAPPPPGMTAPAIPFLVAVLPAALRQSPVDLLRVVHDHRAADPHSSLQWRTSP